MVNLEFDKTNDNKYKLVCPSCKKNTKHIVVKSVTENGSEPMTHSDELFHWTTIYEVIQCMGCETISFRSDSSNSEDYDEEGHSHTEMLFPKRSKDTWHIKNFYNVPSNLRRIYRETVDCYNGDSLSLCGAGTRALVEGLCTENGIKDGEIQIEKPDGTTVIKRKKDLQGKINGLHQKHILTKQSAEILHEHRFLGNSAIHELSAPSKNELKLAIEIIENVFESLYEMPIKAMELKGKRLLK